MGPGRVQRKNAEQIHARQPGRSPGGAEDRAFSLAPLLYYTLCQHKALFTELGLEVVYVPVTDSVTRKELLGRLLGIFSPAQRHLPVLAACCVSSTMLGMHYPKSQWEALKYKDTR